MLVDYPFFIAIEPITTSFLIVGAAKALGLVGAAAGGGAIGNAASQKANGKKKVDWEEAAKKGSKEGIGTLRTSMFVLGVRIPGATDGPDMKA